MNFDDPSINEKISVYRDHQNLHFSQNMFQDLTQIFLHDFFIATVTRETLKKKKKKA